jgi:MarR family transcriptional regulator, organic hydroperoxide resistance regulator
VPELAPRDEAKAGAATFDASREEALGALGLAFRQAFRSLRSLRGRDTHHGDEVGHAQFELLHELYAGGPMQAGELAEAVLASAATVSGMLDHLCEADLVERSRSESDRRIVVVKLTRRGRRKVEARKALWQRRWQEALEGIDDEELRTAARVLDRIGGIFREQQRGG